MQLMDQSVFNRLCVHPVGTDLVCGFRLRKGNSLIRYSKVKRVTVVQGPLVKL